MGGEKGGRLVEGSLTARSIVVFTKAIFTYYGVVMMITLHIDINDATSHRLPI
jgi:hypothetical protein